MNHNILPSVVDLLIPLLSANKQTTGVLRKKNCYCFEGLLCEAYRQANPDVGCGWVNDQGTYVFYVHYKDDHGHHYESDDEIAPLVVRRWATGGSRHPRFEREHSRFANRECEPLTLAATLNDEGWTFAKFKNELQRD